MHISGRIIAAAGEHAVPVIVIDGEYEGTVSVGFDYENFRIMISCGAYRTVLTEDLNIEDTVRFADEKMYIQKKEHRKQNTDIFRN